MTIKFSLVLLTVGSIIAGAIGSESPSGRQDSRKLGHGDEDAVLAYLQRVAAASDVAIRLYYRGACHTNAKEPIVFPVVKVQPPSKGKTGAAAVREIFRNDKNVIVTEEPIGIIRIRIGKVPAAILHTKLSLLTLDEIGQYNPKEAIIAINNTKEMQTAMRSLGVIPIWSASSARALPAKELPHLPATMRNVTVEQVLDLIAKAWDGPVIYGVCAGPTDSSGVKRFFIDSAQDVIPKGGWKKMGPGAP